MTIPIETLKKFKRNIFVETGTHEGFCIQKALDVGFKKAISVEMDVKKYRISCDKFKDNKNITLMNGTSLEHFGKMMELVDLPSTIWLDAHDPKQCSLETELKVLQNHNIKNHIILIDDIRLLKIWGLNVDTLKSEILKINPKYQFSFEMGYQKDDILACRVPCDYKTTQEY